MNFSEFYVQKSHTQIGVSFLELESFQEMKDVLTQLLENLEKTPETARTETTRTETARTERSIQPGGILDELNDDSFASISDENSDDAENADGANLKTETCEICGKVSFIVFFSCHC